MIELSTAYFFIGHRGYLTKEDVRSAYDVSNKQKQKFLLFILKYKQIIYILGYSILPFKRYTSFND